VLGEEGDPKAPDGTGAYVLVTIGAGIEARTILPRAEELFYTLTFTNTATSASFTETLVGGTQKSVGLPAGTWSLVVEGFRNPSDTMGGVSVAGGSVTGIISGTTPTVNVELTATQSGTGTLRYDLSWPSSPQVTDAWLSLERIGGSPFSRTISLPVTDDYGDSRNSNSGRIGLASGFYWLKVWLFNGKIALAGDLVHIYDNLETPASLSVGAADFAECLDLGALETALAAAKAAAEGVRVSADGTDVPPAFSWVTSVQMDTLNNALTAAEAILAAHGAGSNAAGVAAAVSALTTAAAPFGVNPGSYNAAGDLTLGLYIDGTLEAGAGTTLDSILAYLQANASDNTNYTVILGADESLPPWTLGGYSSGSTTVFNGKTGITLTLKGKNPGTLISLSANGRLFSVNDGVKLVLDQNITLKGRTTNNDSLLYMYYGSVEMRSGSKITGNTSSYGGGVYVGSNGTFTMSDGEISGNTASYYGGGVYVEYGTFNMSGGEISGNTSFYLGGGVYNYNGTFTMSGGEISGNTTSSSSSSYGGGGVSIVGNGTFTMSDGEISGNTSSNGSGVYVDGGAFSMSGGALVALNNPVYLSAGTNGYGVITIGGGLSGAGPVALVEPATDPGFIGKPFIKWAEGQSGTLPVGRFAFTGGWTADAGGVLEAKALPLGAPGEETSAYLGVGDTHFYRFTPTLNRTYNVTISRDYSAYYNNFTVVAAWADGSGTLMQDSPYSYYYTSPGFIANKTGVDIIIMVSFYNGYTYTVKYDEVP
jgi:hypothetical protein